MILKLALNLPEDGTYVRIVRRLCRTLLDELGADKSDREDLEILIGELCTNVLRHAGDHDKRYQVVLEFYADHADLTVIDTGEGFAFKDVPEAGTLRPDTFGNGERIGGYGMGLVRALADKLEFRRTDPHGTTVHARVNLHYPTLEDAQKAALLDNDCAADVTITTG